MVLSKSRTLKSTSSEFKDTKSFSRRRRNFRFHVVEHSLTESSKPHRHPINNPSETMTQSMVCSCSAACSAARRGGRIFPKTRDKILLAVMVVLSYSFCLKCISHILLGTTNDSHKFPQMYIIISILKKSTVHVRSMEKMTH